MDDVDWSNVKVPEAQAEAPKKSNPLGTIVFVILLVVGLVVGGGYVNMVALGERVREIVKAECPDTTCVVEAREAHPDCFDANVSFGPPSSLADFQTGPTSPKLGIASVDLARYKSCVMPAKAKTLADRERQE